MFGTGFPLWYYERLAHTEIEGGEIVNASSSLLSATLLEILGSPTWYVDIHKRADLVS